MGSVYVLKLSFRGISKETAASSSRINWQHNIVVLAKGWKRPALMDRIPFGKGASLCGKRIGCVPDDTIYPRFSQPPPDAVPRHSLMVSENPAFKATVE